MANQTILRPWGHYTPVDSSLTRVKLNPQQITELSRTPLHDVGLVITQGECGIVMGDNTVKLTRGDYYLIPAGTWRQLSNQGGTPCKLIEITHES